MKRFTVGIKTWLGIEVWLRTNRRPAVQLVAPINSIDRMRDPHFCWSDATVFVQSGLGRELVGVDDVRHQKTIAPSRHRWITSALMRAHVRLENWCGARFFPTHSILAQRSPEGAVRTAFIKTRSFIKQRRAFRRTHHRYVADRIGIPYSSGSGIQHRILLRLPNVA